MSMVVQAHSFNSARAIGTLMLQIFFLTDRDLFALCDLSRLYEISRVQMSCKMQRDSTCSKDIESHRGQTNLYSMERVLS